MSWNARNAVALASISALNGIAIANVSAVNGIAKSAPSNSFLTNLISYWNLDEASGSARDAHSTNDLTDNSTVGSATGIINTGRDFESSNNEYFDHASNAALTTGDIDFTVSAWVNFETVADDGAIIQKGWDGTNNEYVLHANGGKMLWRVWSTSQVFVFASSFGTMSTGVWYHVIAYHDSVNNQIGICINDGTVDTNSTSAGVQSSTGALQIGALQPFGFYFDGIIDEVAFWKRMLTAPERTALYNAGAGLAYSSFS